MNLFRIRGIQLAVHASFLPLIAYVAYEGWQAADGYDRAMHWLGLGWSVTFIVLTFVCVTLHELGHCFMARRFGVRVPRILLLPIGGMAEFDSIPRQPGQEILIALAGPAVNFVLIGVLMIFVRFPAGWDADLFSLTTAEMLRHLVLVNLVMGVFNLVPVFPMDGGRVFRALLARRLPYLKATRIAVRVGQTLAALAALVLVFYYHHYLGGALFAFIFVAGEIEWRAAKQAKLEADYWRKLAAYASWAHHEARPSESL